MIKGEQLKELTGPFFCLLVVVIVAVVKGRIILGAGLVFYFGFQMDIGKQQGIEYQVS